MFTPAQLETMLHLQCEMNAAVNPKWLAADYPFLRAVVVEGAEALEHHGWKWWKHQTMDKGQLALELVDILHFYLSHEIVTAYQLPRGNELSLAELLERASRMVKADMPSADGDGGGYINLGRQRIDPDTAPLLSVIEAMIALAVFRETNWRLLLAAASRLDLTCDAMFSQYVAKNVLNIFRQQHGYKEGHYQKTWDGREDNEHLAEIMAQVEPDAPDYIEQVRDRLTAIYPGEAATPAA